MRTQNIHSVSNKKAETAFYAVATRILKKQLDDGFEELDIELANKTLLEKYPDVARDFFDEWFAETIQEILDELEVTA